MLSASRNNLLLRRADERSGRFPRLPRGSKTDFMTSAGCSVNAAPNACVRWRSPFISCTIQDSGLNRAAAFQGTAVICNGSNSEEPVPHKKGHAHWIAAPRHPIRALPAVRRSSVGRTHLLSRMARNLSDFKRRSGSGDRSRHRPCDAAAPGWRSGWSILGEPGIGRSTARRCLERLDKLWRRQVLARSADGLEQAARPGLAASAGL